MSGAEIAALLAALGVGTILPKLTEGLIGWLSGRQDAEYARIRQLVEDREHAERSADREAFIRRRVEEHASRLRCLLISCGTPEEEIPPWPIPTWE